MTTYAHTARIARKNIGTINGAVVISRATGEAIGTLSRVSDGWVVKGSVRISSTMWRTTRLGTIAMPTTHTDWRAAVREAGEMVERAFPAVASLYGTPRQVSYAADVRDQLLTEIAQAEEKALTEYPEAAAIIALTRQLLSSERSASKILDLSKRPRTLSDIGRIAIALDRAAYVALAQSLVA